MGVHCASCCFTDASCSDVRQGRAREASHKSCFQLDLVCFQTQNSFCRSSFSSPLSLGEAASIHTHSAGYTAVSLEMQGREGIS